MPKFTALCRVDAYVDYVAQVEARSAKQAALLADETPEAYSWEELGPVEFDARGYVALNRKGWQIEGTKTGYFG